MLIRRGVITITLKFPSGTTIEEILSVIKGVKENHPNAKIYVEVAM